MTKGSVPCEIYDIIVDEYAVMHGAFGSLRQVNMRTRALLATRGHSKIVFKDEQQVSSVYSDMERFSQVMHRTGFVFCDTGHVHIKTFLPNNDQVIDTLAQIFNSYFNHVSHLIIFSHYENERHGVDLLEAIHRWTPFLPLLSKLKIGYYNIHNIHRPLFNEDRWLKTIGPLTSLEMLCIESIPAFTTLHYPFHFLDTGQATLKAFCKKHTNPRIYIIDGLLKTMLPRDYEANSSEIKLWPSRKFKLRKLDDSLEVVSERFDDFYEEDADMSESFDDIYKPGGRDLSQERPRGER